ncbi:MAG: hypothetical protein ASARMPRED_005043 [Alectoria sarmentosa]|nr:MAG: hypothetical protein ASARMPRED_005043 [Alectoria sarmentosa]
MSQTQTHTDSVEGQDHDDVQKKAKSRRPASKLNTFTPPKDRWIGTFMVQEISIDYTQCRKEAQNTSVYSTEYESIPSKYTSSSFKGSSNCSSDGPTYKWRSYNINVPYSGHLVNTSVCSLQFNIPDNLKPPVLLYYRLTNFYQNHRRYVKSLDSNQLKGDAISNNSLGACSPLNTDPDGKPYWPCGLIANSIFNDSFANPVQLNVRDSSALNTTYNMTKNGIAWNSDKALYAATKYDPADISPPPNWHLRYQDNYTSENLPDLESDEGFQVWMRTAGLPNFSKLAMRNDNETMQCGMYQVDIQNNFPVDIYGGTKSLVISTRTVMGGKNPFLGIADRNRDFKTSFAHPTGISLDLLNERALGPVGHVSLFQNVTRKCGTPDPSNELRQAHADFLQQSRHSKKKRQASSPIVVQTYVHFVSTIDQENYYPPSVRTAMITAQVAVLTSLYRPANISFKLISTTWTVNDGWATDANSTLMKQSLRRGNYEALNIYFQTNLSSAPYTYSSSSTLLGYCTLPTTITYQGQNGPVEYPTVDYATDGCNVLAGSMPKAPFPVYGYHLGKTAVHEDNTCATGDPGDYCDDTPQESQSTTGCPTGKDSCPSSPGLDPISNYMDYSTDAW